MDLVLAVSDWVSAVGIREGGEREEETRYSTL